MQPRCFHKTSLNNRPLNASSIPTAWLLRTSLLVCYMALSGCAEKIDSANEFTQLGRLRERQDNYAAAIEAYTQAIDIEPENADSWFDRAVANFAAGNADQAIEDYSQAIEIDPDFALALTSRAAACVSVGQDQAAIDDCTRAIDIDPLDTFAWFHRGQAFYNLALYDESIADLTQAINLDPGDPSLFVARGLSHLDSAQPNLAAMDCDIALDMDDSIADAWLYRAIARHRLGDHDGATSDLAEAHQRGLSGDSETVAELSQRRRQRLPRIVAAHLTEGGYELREDGWMHEGNRVRIMAKPRRNDGTIRFKTEELAAFDRVKLPTVLVVFERTADGVQIDRTVENWTPSPDALAPTSFAMPLDPPQ